MSYDVWLEIDTGGPEPAELYWRNHTSNTSKMWRFAGCDISEFHGRSASEFAESLLYATTAMRLNPAKFKPFEPDNGWGSYDSTVAFLDDLLRECLKHPRATVKVWQ